MFADGDRVATVVRTALLLYVLGFAPTAACRSPTPSSTVTPRTAICGVPQGNRVVGWIDGSVGKTDGQGCEKVGGNAFHIDAGMVTAVATWSDPDAVLKVEIWGDNFQQLLGTGLPVNGQRCSSASVHSESTRIVVRVCHTADSRVPPSGRSDSAAFTPFHLDIAQ